MSLAAVLSVAALLMAAVGCGGGGDGSDERANPSGSYSSGGSTGKSKPPGNYGRGGSTGLTQPPDSDSLREP